MKHSAIATLVFLMLAACGYNIASAQRIMVTYAGTGIAGFSGDGLPGKSAKISGPNDVCMDAAHNIYFVDQNNNRIRMISATTGVVSTIAGGGTSAADGVPAITAALTPNYMCIDAAGNLYISTSNEIRKINTATGIITTVAGTSTAGFTGDGGPAIAAKLNGPMGVCIDVAGNIYFVDANNNRIRTVTAATGIISTIAGTGVSSYSGDGGLALSATLSGASAIGVDGSGNVFFSDQDGNYVREVIASTGMMVHIAGIPSGVVAAAAGGPAATTAIGQVYGIHVDGAGDVYCTDQSCSCVKIDMASGNIDLEAGSLSVDGYNYDDADALSEYLNVPGGLWVDNAGNIYIADNNNNRMRKAIQLTHTPTFAFGKAQSIIGCPTGYSPLDSQLTITDMDAAQTETWTVLSAPVHGSLTGFPYSAASLGTVSSLTPTGVLYVSSYTGLDSFQVQVSDGALADTVTIYINMGAGTITGPGRVCASATITLADAVQGGAWSAVNSNATLSGNGLVTGVSAGTDIIQYTIPAACGVITATSTVTIDIVAPDDAGTITGPASVCAGTTVTMADPTDAGAWSVSNTGATVSVAGVITGVTAGSDTVLYTVSNGCGSVATSEVITINPQPSVSPIITEPTVCIGSTVTLIDAAPGGVWSAGNSHSTITSAGVATGVTAGVDTIFYAVTNTCGTATASQPIIVHDCTTGISPLSSTPGMNIFPNPATSALNIAWTALQPGNATIVITDVTSREVLRTASFDNNNGSGETQMDISNLKDGIYFLNFNSESAHYTNKFVVSK